MHTEELRIETGSQEQVYDLTPDCRAFLGRSTTGDGLLHVWVPHATAGLAVIETGAGSDHDLLAALRDLLVARLVDDPAELLDAAPDEVAEIQQRARPHSPETLQQLFRVLLVRNQDLPNALRPDHVLEMAVARLASLPEAEDLGRLIARLDALEDGGPGPQSGGGGSGGRSAAAPARAPQAVRGPGGPIAPPAEAQRRAPEQEARLRSQAKDHPSVRQAIELLDAELREVRLPRGAEAAGE